MKRLSNKLYIALVAAAVALQVGCTKGFEDLNTPKDKASSASTPELFNAIISSLPQTAGEQSVINSWIYPITQQAIVVSGAYPYDNAKNSVWETYYLALGNYRVLEDRISKDPAKDTYNNVMAMLKTVMAYHTLKTTNYYGNMPYKDAGFATLSDATRYKAPYDKQEDIYSAVLNDLKWAVDNLSTNATQVSLGAYETLLKNDIALWVKFANSLRLQAAITVYDKSPAIAGPQITEALGKPLLVEGEDIGLWPSQIPNLRFEWRQWSFSANCYLRMGSTMWNLMSANNNTDGSGIFDPRCKYFFETNVANQWAAYPQNPTTATPSEGGAPYNLEKRTAAWSDKGVGNTISNVNFYFEKDMTSIPELMLTASQVHLLKAEAYNRGLGVPANAATAKTEYEAGIRASVNMWTKVAFTTPDWTVNKPASATASNTEINTLLAAPAVNYSGTPATALDQIYAQYWVSTFRQPWDAWTLLRRTGGKTPMSASNTQYYTTNYSIYNRFVYPDNEFSYNFDNWKLETGSTDLPSKKIWLQP
ncbi:MAG: SusD/RagB family nutrient-binding outer membrane lipoprotein [Chitinophagaceae bacterium]|nr:MAG: SusD/RagB family nutrient-binding outer membrane lipoprotein [Chitinophagaceae bacterium]